MNKYYNKDRIHVRHNMGIYVNGINPCNMNSSTYNAAIPAIQDFAVVIFFEGGDDGPLDEHPLLH